MALLGLDCATATGWALKNIEGIKAGTWKPKYGSDQGGVFFDFNAWLYRFCIDHDVKAIGLEEPLRSDLTKTEKTFDAAGLFGTRERVFKKPITNVSTLRRLYGLAAGVHSVAYALDLPVYEANQAAWRSAFLGLTSAPKSVTKGRREWLKNRAIQACARLDIEVDSDNAAEAVGVVTWLHAKRKEERLAAAASKRANPLDRVFRQ